MKKLEKDQQKKVKGGIPIGGFKLWRCNVDGYFENVCYAVQPQGPCGYAAPCSQIGTCTRAFCIY
jgi:hypothetical protein